MFYIAKLFWRDPFTKGQYCIKHFYVMIPPCVSEKMFHDSTGELQVYTKVAFIKHIDLHLLGQGELIIWLTRMQQNVNCEHQLWP